jgi:hypothetical protein
MRVLQKVEVVGFTASLNMRLILVNGLAVNLRGGKNAVGRKQTVGGYDTQANVTGGQHEKVGSGLSEPGLSASSCLMM